jgi:hypothetical protein
VDEQGFHGIADGGVLHLGIVGDVDRFPEVRVTVHVDVADAFAMAEHGDAAVLHDVADEGIRAAGHDKVDVLVQGENLGYVFARVNQDHRVDGNVRERGKRIAPDRDERGVRFGGFRAALQAHRISRFQSQRRNLGHDVRARLEYDADNAERAGFLVQDEVVVQFRGCKPAVQRIGQPRDVADFRGHFGDASLCCPQPGEHRAGKLSTLDGLLRRRAILFVRGENFVGARFDRVRRGEEGFVPSLAG